MSDDTTKKTSSITIDVANMTPDTTTEHITKRKRCDYSLSQKKVAKVCNVTPLTLRKNVKILLRNMDAKSVVEIFRE